MKTKGISIAEYYTNYNKLSNRIRRIPSALKEEPKFTRRHFSALYEVFREEKLGLVQALLYDLKITLGIIMNEDSRSETLNLAYGNGVFYGKEESSTNWRVIGL